MVRRRRPVAVGRGRARGAASSSSGLLPPTKVKTYGAVLTVLALLVSGAPGAAAAPAAFANAPTEIFSDRTEHPCDPAWCADKESTSSIFTESVQVSPICVYVYVYIYVDIYVQVNNIWIWIRIVKVIRIVVCIDAKADFHFDHALLAQDMPTFAEQLHSATFDGFTTGSEGGGLSALTFVGRDAGGREIGRLLVSNF
jgi:hypothetical protein